MDGCLTWPRKLLEISVWYSEYQFLPSSNPHQCILLTWDMWYGSIGKKRIGWRKRMEGNGRTEPKFVANGRSLVDFWSHASQKGLMNQNTAASLRAACSEVMGVLEDWENVDLRGLDLEETIRRFQNLGNSKYKPESLQAYARRFRMALPSFLSYLDNPAGWKPAARDSRAREKQAPTEQSKQRPPGRGAPPKPLGGLLDYFFPLRENQTIQLSLPPDLKMAEVERLQAFLASLAIDFPSRKAS